MPCRRPALVVALACSPGLLAGCGEDDKETATTAPGRPATPAVAINIASFRYAPESVTLSAGGEVTWVNRDKAPHTAQNTGEQGPAEFDTGRLTAGQSKSVPLDKPGVYRYYCIYHRFMRASVTVVK